MNTTSNLFKKQKTHLLDEQVPLIYLFYFECLTLDISYIIIKITS